MKQSSIVSFFEKPLKISTPLLIEAIQITPNHDETEHRTTHSTALKQNTSSLLDERYNGASPSLIQIVQVEDHHLSTLRAMTSTLLPVKYSDKFYRDCLTNDARQAIARIIIYDSKIVGWIRCRLEPAPGNPDSGHFQLYIQALGILAPFRGLGLATKLLDTIEKLVRELPFRVTGVYAHVWEDNDGALSWYEKRGFRRVMLLQQYYRRLRPSGAWTVRREIAPV